MDKLEDKQLEKLELEVTHLRQDWRRHYIPSLLSLISSLALAAVALVGACYGVEAVDIQRERNAQERERLQHERGLLREAETGLTNMTAYFFTELSGLTATNIYRSSPRPLVAAVHDEMKALLVLRPRSEAEIAVWAALSLGDSLNDLEALCFDGHYYYTIASLRDPGDEAEMTIARFKLKVDEETGNHRFLESADLTMKPERIGEALNNAGVAFGKTMENSTPVYTINGQRWGPRNRKKTTTFALQVEGAVCRENRLLLGLRSPQGPSGEAILLEFTLYTSSATLQEQVPKVHMLDVLRRSPNHSTLLGISALAYDDEKELLFVALNPPEKDEGDENKVYPRDIYGFTTVAWYRENSGGTFEVVGHRQYSNPHAKLEGLTVVRDELWLAFEGEEPCVERLGLADFRRSKRSWRGSSRGHKEPCGAERTTP